MSLLDLDALARIIWDYHHLNHVIKKCDAIFALCSLDTRVAERAAKLYLDGFGDYVIFSGGVGKLTENRFSQPEANVFANIAENMGVPIDKILIESQSTNTGENIRFTYALLNEKDLYPRSFILVQKPYMERRTYATFKKQWLNPKTEIIVTSPQISYKDYFNNANPKELIINIMVGDLQRIKEYPKQGFQIEQDIPGKVWDAYNKLVDLGYDKHLII